MTSISARVNKTLHNTWEFATDTPRWSQVKEVLSSGKQVLLSVREITSYFGAFRNAWTLGKYSLDLSYELKALEKTKYLGIVVTPFYLYEFGRHSCKVVNRVYHIEILKAMKSAAKVVSDSASLTQVGGTTVLLLKEVGALAPHVASIASIIYGIAGFLSIASIGLNTWGLIKTYRDAAFLNEEDGFALELLKEMSEKELKSMFKARDIKEALNHPDAKIKLVPALKRRLTYKKINHALKILSATITIVASAILLSHAGAPAGVALLAVSGLITFSASIINLYAAERLKYMINDLQPEKKEFKDCTPVWVYKKTSSLAVKVYQITTSWLARS